VSEVKVPARALHTNLLPAQRGAEVDEREVDRGGEGERVDPFAAMALDVAKRASIRDGVGQPGERASQKLGVQFARHLQQRHPLLLTRSKHEDSDALRFAQLGRQPFVQVVPGTRVNFHGFWPPARVPGAVLVAPSRALAGDDLAVPVRGPAEL